MNLETLGWKETFIAPTTDFSVGRIITEQKGMYRVIDGNGEYLGELTGKFQYESISRHDYPTVGDWVWMKVLAEEGKVMIHGVFPRFSLFSRKVAGNRTDEQLIAANVDYVFLVNALNDDFNLRRIERYLLLSYESGASPIIVLTKMDLCSTIEEKIASIEEIAIGVPIFTVDSLQGNGIEMLQSYVAPGKTIALLGSSGVGKSTLLNALMGMEAAKTGGIRNDDKGRHTTTYRELFFLPSGGMVIDTPGMRELQLWNGDSSIDATFSDVESLANNCRFGDCKHQNEPGCAVNEALSTGELTKERLASYQKLQKEIAYNMRKQDASLARAEKEKWKKLHISVRNKPKKR